MNILYICNSCRKTTSCAEHIDERCRTCKNKATKDFPYRAEKIDGRGDIELKTAELLAKTKTFQTAEHDILHNAGRITQVDLPMEYGRVCLTDQVGKHMPFSLSLEHEIDSVDEFVLWMDEACRKQNPSLNMRDLYDLVCEEKTIPVVKRYLVVEMADRIVKAAKDRELLSISGIACLNSREVMIFAGRLLEKMAQKMKSVVWLDSKEQVNLSEERLREMFCGEIFRLHPEDMLLPKEDIRLLADICLQGRSDIEKDQIAGVLWDYFGGLPAGICYALGLMADPAKKMTLDYICSLKDHPVYERYGRNCLTKRLSEKSVSVLRGLVKEKEITGADAREKLRIQWADEYLRFLKEEGILLYDRERNAYLLPGVFRDYLLTDRKDGMVREYRTAEETENRSGAGKVRIRSFGSFHVEYLGMEPKWRTKKTKELFAFLFNKQGVPVSRDMIIGNLWPEMDEDKARKLFYTTMTYLRKNMKEIDMPELVMCRKGMYFLDTRKIESDYRSIMETKECLDQEKWSELKKLPDIKEFCHGSYLEFCAEEWTYGVRAYMERIVQQCLRSLGAYKMRIGETAEAAEYLEVFRNEDPYSEDIAAMLITAYGRLGDYKNANRVYREYEDLYIREFEEKPGPEIQKAFEGCRKKW